MILNRKEYTELKERIDIVSEPNYITHEKSIVDSLNKGIAYLKKKIQSFKCPIEDYGLERTKKIQSLTEEKNDIEAKLLEKDKILYQKNKMLEDNNARLIYISETYGKLAVLADSYNILIPKECALPQSVINKVNEINTLNKEYKTEINQIKSSESKIQNYKADMEVKKKRMMDILVQLQKQLSLYDMYSY